MNKNFQSNSIHELLCCSVCTIRACNLVLNCCGKLICSGCIISCPSCPFCRSGRRIKPANQFLQVHNCTEIKDFYNIAEKIGLEISLVPKLDNSEMQEPGSSFKSIACGGLYVVDLEHGFSKIINNSNPICSFIFGDNIFCCNEYAQVFSKKTSDLKESNTGLFFDAIILLENNYLCAHSNGSLLILDYLEPVHTIDVGCNVDFFISLPNKKIAAAFNKKLLIFSFNFDFIRAIEFQDEITGLQAIDNYVIIGQRYKKIVVLKDFEIYLEFYALCDNIITCKDKLICLSVSGEGTLYSMYDKNSISFFQPFGIIPAADRGFLKNIVAIKSCCSVNNFICIETPSNKIFSIDATLKPLVANELFLQSNEFRNRLGPIV